MLFAAGTPRVLRCSDVSQRHVASLSFSDHEPLLAVVTSSAVQVWGGGQARWGAWRECVERLRGCARHNAQHRVKLGELERTEASLSVEGLNVKAVWRPGHSVLAVLVCARLAQSLPRAAANPGSLTPRARRPPPASCTCTPAGRAGGSGRGGRAGALQSVSVASRPALRPATGRAVPGPGRLTTAPAVRHRPGLRGPSVVDRAGWGTV